MQAKFIPWPHNTYAVDAIYVRPGLAAIHFIVEKGRVAVIETAHNAALPRFLEALKELNLTPEAVDYVFVTHVHLDHAGGAGAYMAELPNAKLVVHPRGARHMIDPTQLFAGASAVYGEETARKLYGEIVPVPAERVIEAADEEFFSLAGRPLQCLFTPGHAKHHLCVWDSQARVCFTGDAFGIAYPELIVDKKPFLIPATTPSQFDPEAMKASIKRLLALKPEAMYLMHFSRVDDVERQGRELLARIDDFVRLAEAAPGTGTARKEAIHVAIESHLMEEIVAKNRDKIKPILNVDMELNAQGLALWLEQREG
ncbi:MAG: MBL fold metallo-hydrolase [Betaproteobacteria bacterium]|nr:MBL fold metallo-hydrolase [Betaproteobacteria bacterium]